MTKRRCTYILALVLSVTCGAEGTASDVMSDRIASLEEAFWICDYVATMRGVSATPMAACSTAYRDLRDEKFGGRFEALLAWWTANKAVQHRKIEAQARQ